MWFNAEHFVKSCNEKHLQEDKWKYIVTFQERCLPKWLAQNKLWNFIQENLQSHASKNTIVCLQKIKTNTNIAYPNFLHILEKSYGVLSMDWYVFGLKKRALFKHKPTWWTLENNGKRKKFYERPFYHENYDADL